MSTMTQRPRRPRRSSRVRTYAPTEMPGSVTVPEDLFMAVTNGAISLYRAAMAVRLR
ncbi:hypothetical protein [Nocardiopsis sp. YSL2]|uniref:hypothetical protein n=1 Tax=Nocardiopsis sp. YSL2 TaxID=2939492 RepID=UPI0026F47442|nr:hypothetical protein [Nocardiopsis sp. YSL2]